MKINFNLPVKRYSSDINFDNNTTFGVGNLQPLFCKFVLPKSTFSCNINQLTRLSPLVVPSFARLKQINDFVYVNINKVFPAFDAFLSNTPVAGTASTYTPHSVPCITNQRLFTILLIHFSKFVSATPSNSSWSNFKSTYQVTSYVGNTLVDSHVDVSSFNSDRFQKLVVASDFLITGGVPGAETSNYCAGRFTQEGRFWLSVLRGLGYSCDYHDDKPVSVLPLWAFCKAYYDLYYPKRYNSWHNSSVYYAINNHYNGDFKDFVYEGHHYDMVNTPLLTSLFGSDYSFWAYAVLDNDVFQAALSNPLNDVAADPITLSSSVGDNYLAVESGIPMIKADPDTVNISSDNLSLVNRLWKFVSRSSVVGQSVKDWFQVHFGVSPSEDMFDTSVCFAQKPNMININAVVSTADTSPQNGSQLGDLAGQAYSNVSDSVSFDVPNFGFIMCISGLQPLSRVSGGTQPELYNTSYYDMPFPDFDGLGYEVLNNTSFMETQKGNYDLKNRAAYSKSGYGYVPRFTSYKTLNNIRSGGFCIPSIQDSYLSYCEDSIIDTLSTLPSPTNLKAFFPWRYSGFTDSFLDYNRIFYNQSSPDPFFNNVFYVDDNFMCQSAFDIKISSYLKPISDSYSIEELGNKLVSVKRQ